MSTAKKNDNSPLAEALKASPGDIPTTNALVAQALAATAEGGDTTNPPAPEPKSSLANELGDLTKMLRNLHPERFDADRQITRLLADAHVAVATVVDAVKAANPDKKG